MPFSFILHVRAAYPALKLAPNPLISFSIQYDLYVEEGEREREKHVEGMMLRIEIGSSDLRIRSLSSLGYPLLGL